MTRLVAFAMFTATVGLCCAPARAAAPEYAAFGFGSDTRGGIGKAELCSQPK